MPLPLPLSGPNQMQQPTAAPFLPDETQDSFIENGAPPSPIRDVTVKETPPAVGSQNISTETQPQQLLLESDVTLPASLTVRLYISHFLSTWNSRVFEFAAVLFLASIFPLTLLPMSVYALARCGVAIVFSPAVGSRIDNSDRLAVVRASIVGQRLAVAASCGVLWVMKREQDMEAEAKQGLFALIVLLACVEKLCSVMNLVSVERDWVVVMTEGNESARRVLNARIRRIDLLCKLLGPLVISLIAGASTLIAIWTVLGMNLGPIVLEYVCIAQVYQRVPGLSRNQPPVRHGDLENTEMGPPAQDTATEPPPVQFRSQLGSAARHLLSVSSIPFYVRHRAFLPSLSLALLYFTVLSMSGQMITFLLSVGYTSTHVGVVRTVSTILELSATWIAPRLIGWIGPVRAGIWSLSWQMIWLAGALSWFFAYWAGVEKASVMAVSGLVGGVALSRIGLWGFDLCAQNIVQDEVDASHRGAFSTVEASAQNFFELLSYASTIVFSRPDQFQWPVVISIAAVYAAGGLYTWYVRQTRGHLLHSPPCIKRKGVRQ